MAAINYMVLQRALESDVTPQVLSALEWVGALQEGRTIKVLAVTRLSARLVKVQFTASIFANCRFEDDAWLIVSFSLLSADGTRYIVPLQERKGEGAFTYALAFGQIEQLKSAPWEKTQEVAWLDFSHEKRQRLASIARAWCKHHGIALDV